MQTIKKKGSREHIIAKVKCSQSNILKEAPATNHYEGRGKSKIIPKKKWRKPL